MTNDLDLEARLAALEKELAAKSQNTEEAQDTPVKPRKAGSKRKTKTYLSVAAIIMLFLVGAGASWYLWEKDNRSATPIPRSVVSQAGFKVYYPSTLPKGFTYKPDSANNTQSIVTYTLTDGSNDIIVTQQPAPKEVIKIDGLPGFLPTASNAGQAYIGKAAGKEVVILKTESALINLASSGKVPRSALTEITRTMTEIEE